MMLTTVTMINHPFFMDNCFVKASKVTKNLFFENFDPDPEIDSLRGAQSGLPFHQRYVAFHSHSLCRS